MFCRQRWLVLGLLVLGLLVGVFGSGCSGGLAKVKVGRFLTSGRDGWQHPEQVIEALNIRSGDQVAEIGAGKGYWLRSLSAAVGAEGRVYAVEVEPELVEALAAKVDRYGLKNVEVILGSYTDPRLPDGAVDLAMTCLTYHHIEEREVYFSRLRQDLSPRGRVAHLDDRPDVSAPIAWFQSAGHWTDPAAMVEEMAAAGYRLEQRFDFLPAQSFQIFSYTPVDEGPAAAEEGM
ncbi:MAG: methyltransferase domain-containing protein [Myxococcota bacterium]